jgi:putative glutamine transport system substrate-binding protein
MAGCRPLAVALAVAALLALAGCAAPAAALGRGTPSAPGPGALGRIRAAGVLRVGIREDAPPMGFRRPGSLLPEGFELDLGRALAAALLGDPNKVAWVPVGTSRLLALDAGEADVVIAGVAPAAGEGTRYRFSPPYYRSPVVLIARRGSPLRSLRSLDGQVVATLPEDGGAGALLAAAARAQGATVILAPQPSPVAAVAAVQAGEAAGLVTVRALAPAWLTTDPQLRMWQPGAGSVAYVAAVRADAPDLAAFVDAALRDLVGGPTWRSLLRKWGLPVP